MANLSLWPEGISKRARPNQLWKALPNPGISPNLLLRPVEARAGRADNVCQKLTWRDRRPCSLAHCCLPYQLPLTFLWQHPGYLPEHASPKEKTPAGTSCRGRI